MFTFSSLTLGKYVAWLNYASLCTWELWTTDKVNFVLIHHNIEFSKRSEETVCVNDHFQTFFITYLWYCKSLQKSQGFGAEKLAIVLFDVRILVKDYFRQRLIQNVIKYRILLITHIAFSGFLCVQIGEAVQKYSNMNTDKWFLCRFQAKHPIFRWKLSQLSIKSLKKVSGCCKVISNWNSFTEKPSISEKNVVALFWWKGTIQNCN